MKRSIKEITIKTIIWILASLPISGTIFGYFYVITAALCWGGDFNGINYIPVSFNATNQRVREQLKILSSEDFNDLPSNSFAIYVPSQKCNAIVKIDTTSGFITIRDIVDENNRYRQILDLTFLEIFKFNYDFTQDVLPKLDKKYLINIAFFIMLINEKLMLYYSRQSYHILLILTLLISYYPISKIIDKQNLFKKENQQQQ